ncbi:hypothetical protein JHK85_001433 [Glycine max]|nr:hypothetical protein JHK85_001433 [Glycine max]
MNQIVFAEETNDPVSDHRIHYSSHTIEDNGVAVKDVSAVPGLEISINDSSQLTLSFLGQFPPTAATVNSLLLLGICGPPDTIFRNVVEMDLADLECYGVENPNARLSCFVNKAFADVGSDMAKLVLGCVSIEVDVRLAYDTHAIIRKGPILDYGYGSFGAYFFDSQLWTMCIANYEPSGSQVQLTLERGLPAMIASFTSKQLPYPSLSFDMLH